MTGRIRTVKPEWLEDELLAAASDAARVLSVALILLADDYGNGRASIATIAASVWRFDLERDDGVNAPEVLAKASGAFRELLELRFVGCWTEAGQRYYAVRNWRKHQRVDKPGRPMVPAPPADLFGRDLTGQSADSRGAPEAIASTSRIIRERPAPDLDQRPGPTTNDQEPKPTNARAGMGSRPAKPAAPSEAKTKPTAAAAPKPELPSNLEQALAEPICERARIVIEHPERAEWLQPHRWSEVVSVAEALHVAAGLGPVRLGTYHRDTGVRAVVELFAAGFMPGDIKDACKRIPREPWWTKDGAKRGLASLTPEVMRRAAGDGLTVEQRARVSRAMSGAPQVPTTVGAALANVLPNGGVG